MIEIKKLFHCSLLLLALFTFLVSGCTEEDPKDQYRSEGILESLEKTGGVVDGVKSLYGLKIKNILNSGRAPASDGGELQLSITKNTIIRDEQNKKAGVPALEPGAHVQVTWRFANDHLTEATEIVVLDADPTLGKLQVDQISRIIITDATNDGVPDEDTRELGVLEKKQQFEALSDAVKNSTIVTGPIIAIGGNYDFVLELSTSQRRYGYWNGEHLRMISDYEAKKSYFLSEEAVKMIDSLIDAEGANKE